MNAPDRVRRTGDFRVQPLQRLAQGGRWRTEAMRSYSAPVLYWFTRGQGRFTMQGVTRGYGPHNAILLPPGTMHGFDMMGQVYGAAVFFPRDPALGLPGEALHLRFREAQQQAEMAQQLDNIAREIEQGEPAMERALQHHAGLLGVWLERQAARADQAEPRERAADRLAAAYASLLERDFRSGKSVADYAAELGITATHLSRACRASCGRPASALLHDRLHYEARRLLSETRLPVKEIARSLGFRSAGYFTRAFQHQTGQTPSAFRRSG